MRRAALVQGLVLALIALLLWLLADTTASHLAQRGIRSGFDFLLEPAGFALGESPMAFEPADATWRAFLAGLLNTLRVALPGALLAVLLGILLGFGRLSDNPAARSLCGTVVEGIRNLPLLLHLLAWYFILTDLLPTTEAAFHPAPGLYLSKSGLALPWWGDTGWEIPEPAGFGIEGGARLTPEYLALLIGLSSYAAAYITETLRGAIGALPPG
ncbi:ABC transporter permease subunit [Zoogloea sp.]|uniref:ABC transporter permease subunit n=1 Tax=Zoogloea sp. TaxID=49181 RepID=UPI00261CD4F1|nr:ABC transporter permease subunit [Zoogloea sp.]MDD3353540.1 ABC transporter permease subunit [Zoogloea sp.]